MKVNIPFNFLKSFLMHSGLSFSYPYNNIFDILLNYHHPLILSERFSGKTTMIVAYLLYLFYNKINVNIGILTVNRKISEISDKFKYYYNSLPFEIDISYTRNSIKTHNTHLDIKNFSNAFGKNYDILILDDFEVFLYEHFQKILLYFSSAQEIKVIGYYPSTHLNIDNNFSFHTF